MATLLEMNDLDDGEAVWHRDHRFLLTQFLAARILSTSSKCNPKRWEQALYAQKGEDWQELRAYAIELEPRPPGMRRRTGRPRPGAVGISFEGRGGGAVWRAQRILALPAIIDWLSTSAASTSERTLTVDPPGWQFAPRGLEPGLSPRPASRRMGRAHRHAPRALLRSRPGTSPGPQAPGARGHMIWPTVDDEGPVRSSEVFL